MNMSWHPQIMFQLLAKYQHRECDGQHIPLVPEAEDPIVWTKVACTAQFELLLFGVNQIKNRQRTMRGHKTTENNLCSVKGCCVYDDRASSLCRDDHMRDKWHQVVKQILLATERL